MAREITGREGIEIAAPRAEVYAVRPDCLNLPLLNPAARVDVELTLFPADSVPADELAVMEANAGAPINVALAAMKLALENRPQKREE